MRYLQPEDAGINRFAFVIHPLSLRFIHNHKAFRWTKYLPDDLVEAVAAYMPADVPVAHHRRRLAHNRPADRGHLISLGATPRQMMKHSERFTYRRLNKAARMAERRGARIMGLGAFTSVVGDAGITVAHEADIAITSGNSLTVAMTLEAAKQAVIQMGATDLTRGKAMIIGATGSIGSVCSRLLAQAIKDVVLVSIEPEKLIELKRTIQKETPGARVAIATKTDDLVDDCDLIVTATSAFGQRMIDITKCKPGAVICDVARPPDINPKEAALRPDVLVIESGEVLIPGDIDFGYDIGLPPKDGLCLPGGNGAAGDGRPLRGLHPGSQHQHRAREGDLAPLQEARLPDRGTALLRQLRHRRGNVAEKRALADALRADAAQLRPQAARGRRKAGGHPGVVQGRQDEAQ